MTEEVLVRRDGGVLRLAFNRTAKKNAIVQPMYAALADGLEAAEQDDAIRCVLFEAEGDFFTAGNDINDFMAPAAGEGSETPPVMRFLTALATATKPIVAAVQGPAIGIGVTMLFHCDLVYASERATFHTPFVDLAIVPEAASSLLLPAIAGHQRASELLLLGDKIDAERAAAFGFVNRVVAADALDATAMDAARRLAEKAPAAVRISKRLIKGDREAVLKRMQVEGEHVGAQLQSPEFREAGAAFLAKRKADFSRAS